MTDMRRTLLWVIFGFSLLMLYDGWLKHTGQRRLFEAPRPTPTAPAQPSMPAPTALPAQTVPAVPGAPSASAAAAAAAVTAATAASAPPALQNEKVEIA